MTSNPPQNSRRYKLLLVDDDPEILALLKAKFKDEPFEIFTAAEGASALSIVKLEKPDLIVLDVRMPGLSGLEICRFLKSDKNTREIPIIILSARSDEIDRVLGLEFGADDYVTKPFNSKELILRIHNVLRRVYKVADNTDCFTRGDLSVDFLKHEVTVKGEPIQLTLTEFKLLSSLLETVGQVKRANTFWSMSGIMGMECSPVRLIPIFKDCGPNSRKPDIISKLYAAWAIGFRNNHRFYLG